MGNSQSSEVKELKRALVENKEATYVLREELCGKASLTF
jgi:hypothetical protein